jgi:hypothetical protein
LTATGDTLSQGQPIGDQTREGQPEAVKDNPPRAPEAQRPTSLSLKSRTELSRAADVRIEQVGNSEVWLAVGPTGARIPRVAAAVSS